MLREEDPERATEVLRRSVQSRQGLPTGHRVGFKPRPSKQVTPLGSSVRAPSRKRIIRCRSREASQATPSWLAGQVL